MTMLVGHVLSLPSTRNICVVWMVSGIPVLGTVFTKTLRGSCVAGRVVVPLLLLCRWFGSDGAEYSGEGAMSIGVLQLR